MKFIKAIITSALSLLFSFAGTYSKASSNYCSGFCKVCGGTCIQPVIILPAIGIIIVIKKIINLKFIIEAKSIDSRTRHY